MSSVIPQSRAFVIPKTMIGCLLVAATAAVSGCGRNAGDPLAPAQARGPVAVRIATAVGRDEPVTIEATGSFQADESSDVAPETSGRVIATPVDVGQSVQQGSVLVRIQGVDANLRLDEARANAERTEAAVKLAESQHRLALTTTDRYQSLLATGDVSRTVADQAKTEAETSLQSVNTARASLAQARAQLALAEKAATDVAVLAPFAGVISARQVSAGEYVQPSNPVVTLMKIDPLRLLLTIPSVQAGAVASGQQVTATVDAFPGETFTGHISAVNPAISAESRAFMVEAKVRNPKARLKPGMFAVARIDQGKTSRAVIVPRQAVIEDVNTNSYRVYVVDDKNAARMRVVQLAARQQGEVVNILAGVKENERVATSNLGDLYDGAPVTFTGAGAGAESTDGAGTGAGAASNQPGGQRGGKPAARAKS
jgi:membrane fusion protein (multidrug efflux system)